ncbi:MAG: Gfo/Idh/MocA family oxidoreductase [Candidatus Jordarchaeaceae archaeon]
MKNLSGDNLRLAVVGLGKMGLLHASILNVMQNVKLVAICDKSFMIRQLSKRLLKNVKLADDISELSDLDLDAIFITTPIPSHFFLVKKIYSDKIAKNLFVEKTLTTEYAKSKELCELAKASGGIAMVGYMKRFSVTFMRAKDLIDQKVLGDVLSFDAYAYSSDFSETQSSSSRGGVLVDLGSHVVDLALWFFGDFEVHSAKLQSRNSLGLEDIAEFTIKTSDLTGKFNISWCEKEYRMPEFGLTIRGSNGTIKVNDDEIMLELKTQKLYKWYRHDLNDKVDFLLGFPEYFREDEHFIKAIMNGGKVKSDFLSASKVDFILSKVKGLANKQ